MVFPRIIPTLLLDGIRLVKTMHFRKPVYLGDPINAIKIFNEKEVDEIIVLDITARGQGRNPDMRFLKDLASEAFMPIAFGGGITSFESASGIVALGYEKVVLQNLIFSNEFEVAKIVNVFGSQAVVASLDFFRGRRAHHYLRKEIMGLRLNVQNAVSHCEGLGVGELLATSVDREGTKSGLDLDLLAQVLEAAQRPVIFQGGAQSIDDMKLAIQCGADAVAAGALFVFAPSRKSVLLNYPTSNQRFIDS